MKTQYTLELKGPVGGDRFNAAGVDAVLAEHAGEEVSVYIESLGGDMAQGLAISNSFRAHGAVTAHLSGFVASAATTAALGCKRVTMDSNALYLIHRASYDFFRWGLLNAEDFARMASEAAEAKEDLEKIDQVAASLYASRCNRKPEELLELMVRGGWLTAEETLAWGFVDEITSLEDDEKPELNNAVASAMAAAGIPLPQMAVVQPKNGMERFLTSLSDFFKAKGDAADVTLAARIADLEAAVADRDAQIQEKTAQIADRDARIADRDAQIETLKARLDNEPSEASARILDTEKTDPAAKEEDAADGYNPLMAYCSLNAEVKNLFNSLP